MKTLFEICGLGLVGLSLMHAGFPRYFGWKTELAGLSPINREMMKVHTLFIALTVLLMGLLCLSSATLLMDTVLGRRVSLGLGLFWGLRLGIQIFGYSSSLWRGKRFETAVHILFTVFWSMLTFTFLVAGTGWKIGG